MVSYTRQNLLRLFLERTFLQPILSDDLLRSTGHWQLLPSSADDNGNVMIDGCDGEALRDLTPT